MASGIFYWIIKDTLPKYTGKIYTQEISDTIEIYRDSIGVAYINARTDNDAAFGLGFVHAQERLFQMDMFRRASQGRLS